MTSATVDIIDLSHPHPHGQYLHSVNAAYKSQDLVHQPGLEHASTGMPDQRTTCMCGQTGYEISWNILRIWDILPDEILLDMSRNILQMLPHDWATAGHGKRYTSNVTSPLKKIHHIWRLFILISHFHNSSRNGTEIPLVEQTLSHCLKSINIVQDHLCFYHFFCLSFPTPL